MEQNHVLLLGMYHGTEIIPKKGQEFRDRIRCDALIKLNCKVKTLDDKHMGNQRQMHCRASFTNFRRMHNAVRSKWGENFQKFNLIILDYFFCPDSWADQRWEGLVNETLPKIAESKWLVRNGEIWLPNINTIDNSICSHRQNLEQYFTIYKVPFEEINHNLLYLATESVHIGLHRCKPPLDNANQLEYLTNYSAYPFYKLTIRDRFTSGSVSVDSRAVVSLDTHNLPRSSWSTAAARSRGNTLWSSTSPTNEERSGDGLRGASVQLDSHVGRVVIDLTGDECVDMVDVETEVRDDKKNRTIALL